MADIRAVVYAITPRGFEMLRTDSAVVSLQHKTILTMVDGLCPVAQYIPFLLTFAPLEDKFELLDRLGCVRRVGAVSSAAVKMFEESSRARESVSKMPSIDAEHQSSGFVPFR